jgi:aspartyl aminopeptidase
MVNPFSQLKYPKDKTLDEKSVKPSHHDGLVSLLAEKLNINADSILDFELCLYDTMPAALGGLYNEFIFSPRLDNLMMSFCSLEVFTEPLYYKVHIGFRLCWHL